MPVRTRIERIEGSVVALDVVVGREIDEVRGATLTLWAIPPRALGVEPAGPAGGAAVQDRRRAVRRALQGARQRASRSTSCSTTACARARSPRSTAGSRTGSPRACAIACIPGRGAPLDHPMPLSDLALGRAGDRRSARRGRRAARRDRGARRHGAARAPTPIDARGSLVKRALADRSRSRASRVPAGELRSRNAGVGRRHQLVRPDADARRRRSPIATATSRRRSSRPRARDRGAYDKLAELTDTIGNRLSGSPSLDARSRGPRRR